MTLDDACNIIGLPTQAVDGLRAQAERQRVIARDADAKAQACRRIPTPYWQDVAAEAQRRADIAWTAAEALDTRADRITTDRSALRLLSPNRTGGR